MNGLLLFSLLHLSFGGIHACKESDYILLHNIIVDMKYETICIISHNIH